MMFCVLNFAKRKGRVDLYESEAILVYRVNSRPARAAQRDLVLKRENEILVEGQQDDPLGEATCHQV